MSEDVLEEWVTGEAESFRHRLPMQLPGTEAGVFGNEEEK